MRLIPLLALLTGCNIIIGVHQFDERNDAAPTGDGRDGGDALSPDAAVAAQQAYIKAPNNRAGAFFGSGVALSADGNTLAVGAQRETSGATGIGGNQADTSTAMAGAVYIYVRTGGVWSFQEYIKASNTGMSDQFGALVSLSADGNTLAVGAWGEASGNASESDNSIPYAGAAYVFTRTGAAWTQRAYLKASSPGGDYFGRALALSGDGTTLAVGGYSESSSTTGINTTPNEAAAAAGAVWVYSRSGQSWSQQAYVKPNTVDAGDWFGESVAISTNGNVLAVGAPMESSASTDPSSNAASGAGAVFVFGRNGTTWTQRDYVKPMFPTADDGFGWSVGLSGDGTTLTVGEYADDTASMGVGGAQQGSGAMSSGAAYAFTYVASWTQTTYIKATNAQGGDLFGFSMALSTDGNTLLVGSNYEDGQTTGLDGDQTDNSEPAAGAAYLYTRAGTWMPAHYIKASNTEGFDEFSWRLAMSGDGHTLAIASVQEGSDTTTINGPQDNDNAGQSGAVYVYTIP